jgi:hypothetical protein
MRLALGPKVAVVGEDTGAAEEDEGAAVVSNHRHTTDITMII